MTSSTPRLRCATAGALAAASALAASELVGLLAPTRPSLLIAVETWFVDGFAASLKQVAIDLFGTNDKVALATGTVVMALIFGALLGRAERRRPGAGVVGLAGFGVVGVLATARAPLGSVSVAVLAAVVGVTVGVAVLIALFDRFGIRPGPWARRREASPARSARTATSSTGAGADDGLAVVTANRRDVLAWGAGTGVAVVAAAAVGREARQALRQSASALPEGLPEVTSTIPVPASQPFEVPGLTPHEATSTIPVPASQSFEVPGLTPYIVPNADFYRIDTALQTPVVDAGSWRLKITGMVDREIELSYDDLRGRDLVEEIVTLACVSNEVGGDLVGNAAWRGVPLRTLLEEAGVKDGADQLVGESVDGFTAGFPVSVLDDPDRPALVAIGMNGKPLPRSHGFPARLVVSGLYGYVSATKWLSEIRITTFDEEDGYWIPRGWAKEGPVKTQSRIDVPRAGGQLEAGTQAIAGVAWAPNRGISKVEVRVDGGSWREADLGNVASDDTWVQWHLAWDATAGEHEIEVRATDGDGETQTKERTPVIPDGASGWHARTVRVRR